ncbi:hypothetical protein ACIOEW_31815 [Streptomyces sp. NPDC087901]|uniref:hypothetical protein n=1 Tax=Streptomyces sp. NPDC087901 TaxID=3365818 RepID=UPI00382240AE
MQLTDPEWKFVGPYLPIGRYGPHPERLRCHRAIDVQGQELTGRREFSLTPGGPVTSYDHDAGRACELAQGFAALLDQHAED